MSSRPPVVRTYGKARPSAPASSSSLIFESSPPSSPLLTPHASSDALDTSEIIYLGPQSEKENVMPLPIGVTEKRAVQSTLGSFFNVPNPKKRALYPSTLIAGPSTSSSRMEAEKSKLKKAKTSEGSKGKDKETLTQMYLTHLPLLHTCSQCLMSYVRGGEDESLHERHHARVTRGIIWEGLGRSKGKGKVKERGEGECGWRVVKDNVPFGPQGKGRGRIIVADGSYGGAKLDDILKTVDTVLSSPPLPESILDQCKIFLFTTSSPAPSKRIRPIMASEKRNPKERIVGVVVAQPIKWAMKVLTNTESRQETSSSGEVVDSGDGVLCDSTRLDTPLGIHRLFTIPSYRSLGLAQILLDAACDYTVYGCRFSPSKGQVAFSQPTSSGRAVMEKWGKGEVRVFVDDESQL